MGKLYSCINNNCAIAIAKATFPVAMNCPVCQQSLVEEKKESGISIEDEALINSLPYVIAYPLKQTLLEKHAWSKINLFKDTFQNYLKYLGLLAASEFFYSELKDKKMVALFQQTLAEPSFGTWNLFIRECLKYLNENKHTYFCKELPNYYETIESGKKRKLYSGEIEYIDGNGDVQLKKQEATAIGMLINFRNRYLGHGLTLDAETSQKLWDEYFPLFKTLLQQLSFAKDYPMLKRDGNETHLLHSAEINTIESLANTNAKIWVQNKEGKVLAVVPFFIVPGEVAISNTDKAKMLSYESYTGKTIKFFSPEGIEKQTSGKILERLNLLLREKQKETPFTPKAFTKDQFLNRIAEENKLLLDTLIAEKKIIPGVYQHREEIEIKLREWIGARANIFFIAAEAGSGKTNLLAEIQKQYTERQLPSLLIRAGRMEKQTLKQQIAYLLNIDLEQGLQNYISIAGTQAQPTFILIDGLNEANNAEEIWQETIELSKLFEPGSLKFVITNRANSEIDLDRYTITQTEQAFLYGENKDNKDNKDNKNGLSAFVFWLTALNMKEMQSAWESYITKDKSRFKPLFSFNDLATFDRGLYQQINNPLILRLFLEIYQGKTLPKKGAKYLNIWQDWFNIFSPEEQTFLKLMANAVWEKGENELLLDDLLKNETLKPYFTSDIINAPYKRLKNNGWISRYVKDLNSYISFTVEGALLYLLGVKLQNKADEINIDYINVHLQEGNKLHISAIEVLLCELVLAGDLNLVTELIDIGGKNLEICVIPILFSIKYIGVNETIESLLDNPTINDWKILELVRFEIKKNELNEIQSQYDNVILSTLNSGIFQQEVLKVNCLESLDSVERLNEIKNILNQKLFDRYLDIDKNKLLILLIGHLSTIDNTSAINIYEEYLSKDNLNVDLFLNCKLFEFIGDSFYNSNINNKLTIAEKHFSKGLELIKNENSFDYEKQKLEFNNSIACCKLQKGEYLESEKLFLEICEKTKSLLGSHNSFFILIYSNYADLLRRTNRFTESINILETSLQIADIIAKRNSHTFANIYSALGWNYISIWDINKAIECFKKCLEISYIFGGEFSSAVRYALQNLGVAFLHFNDLENAKANLLKCKELYDREGFPDKNNLAAIGSLYTKEKQYEIAMKYFDEALLLDPIDQNTRRNIGDCYFYMQEYDKAIEVYMEVEKILLNNDYLRLQLAYLYSAFEQVFIKQNDITKALEYCNKEIEIYKNLGFDESNPNLFETYERLANYLSEVNKNDEALEYYEKCLSIQIKNLGAEHPDVATSYNNIGGVWDSKGEYDKALEFFQKSLDIYLKTLGAEHPDVAESYNNIGLAWQSKGNYHKALEYCEKSLAIRLKTLEENHPKVEQSYCSLGLYKKELGRYNEAILDFKSAIYIQKRGGHFFSVAECYELLNNKINALFFFIQSAEVRKERIGINDEATNNSINNAKRLAKELNKENELPEWICRLP